MGADAASMPDAGDPAVGRADPPGVGGGPRLASVVMFVRDLDRSVEFYRELLKMRVTVRTATAALLVGSDDMQVYVRRMGRVSHGLGGIGVQYVIWTADSLDDLHRCERLLRERSARTSSREMADGFTVVEGRDPDDLPLVITYPGPSKAVRHEIMQRIYAW